MKRPRLDQVRILAAGAIGVKPDELPLDADLLKDFKVHPDDFDFFFRDNLDDIIGIPIPYYDVLRVRTVRQADDLLGRYLRDKEKEYVRCLQELNQAINIEPDNKLLYRYRAGLWNILGEPGKVLQDIESCLDIDPWDSEIATWRANVLQQYGDRREDSKNKTLIRTRSTFAVTMLSSLPFVFILIGIFQDQLLLVLLAAGALGGMMSVVMKQVKKRHCRYRRAKRREQREKSQTL